MKQAFKWLSHLFQAPWLKKTNLHYKLNLIFGLFFLFPVLGFLYFAFKYKVLTDQEIPFFFLGVLLFALIGFITLRKLFDEIAAISHAVSRKAAARFSVQNGGDSADELNELVQSFNAIEERFSETFHQLEKKSADISILKELSDLCYVTFDPQEILYVMLERAMSLTDSDVGSVLILEKPSNRNFIVKATIGLGERVKIGDRIDFDASIAKYAVINKSPLVVRDIEKDSRFGRSNRPQYGTKSFACMPIKTSKEILGVLTISRKDQDRYYTPEDVEALTPLLSNAAFTYENLRLIRQNEQARLHLKAVEKIFKLLNSSFRESELFQAILNEFYAILPFDFALVLRWSPNRPAELTLLDLIANGSLSLVRGSLYPCTGSVLEQVIRQKNTLLIEEATTLSHETDQALFTEQGSRCVLLTPLKQEGSVLGILAFSAQQPEIFKENLSLISWMANGLSFAVERSQLREAVAQRNQELASIKQIGRALASSTFDISKVLKYTLDMIRTLINAQAGTLYLVQEEGLEGAVYFNTQIPLENFSLKLKMGQGIAGYVAARGEPVIVNDPQASPHFYPEVDRQLGFETRSVLCVPMISQGKVIGVIQAINKLQGEFTQNDEDLLLSIASSVSIAMENARLYKETVDMAEHERGMRRIFQKFVPKEVLDRILHDSEAGKTAINELKTLTLLNIDLRGSSEFVRRIGPQKTVALLNRFFSVMGGIVFKHQGIVDKYLGDGFLALFGAPVSGVMDAGNAVNAALEMREAVAEINVYCQREFDASIKIGISIHTGEVVVGNIGFDMKMDYTVIGDPVNTVFRLQELTKPFPNGILISEATWRAAPFRLEVEAIDQQLAGIRIYELIRQTGAEEAQEKSHYLAHPDPQAEIGR